MNKEQYLHLIKKSATELKEIVKSSKQNLEDREKTIQRSQDHLENLYRILDMMAHYVPDIDNGKLFEDTLYTGPDRRNGDRRKNGKSN